MKKIAITPLMIIFLLSGCSSYKAQLAADSTPCDASEIKVIDSTHKLVRYKGYASWGVLCHGKQYTCMKNHITDEGECTPLVKGENKFEHSMDEKLRTMSSRLIKKCHTSEMKTKILKGDYLHTDLSWQVLCPGNLSYKCWQINGEYEEFSCAKL